MAIIVLATRNVGKLRELQEILKSSVPELRPEDIVDADSCGCTEIRETGLSFADNALLKARAAARQTRMVAVADDSGLAVKVLGGAPGIFSARWAGLRDGADGNRDRLNRELLLAQLADVEEEYRQAELVCAAAVAHPDGREHVEYGRTQGVVLTAAQGDGGFGYDPIFCPMDSDGRLMSDQGRLRSNAQLNPEEKNRLSHRGQSFKRIAVAVKELCGV